MRLQAGLASRKKRLPDSQAHQRHAQRQPAEESDGDNGLQARRGIRPFVLRILGGLHVFTPFGKGVGFEVVQFQSKDHALMLSTGRM